MKKIYLPLTAQDIKNLRIGEEAFLSGAVYTARDQAHKRLAEMIKKGKGLPVDLKKAAIYYCGPTRTKPGAVIGSCGPTTSGRMDAFTPALIEAGLRCMIGKGGRSKEAIAAIKKYKAVYFITIGGAGAYLSKKVKKAKVVAFGELGPEAIYKLEIKDFPVIVWSK